ncbi:MAG TPA: hypothetical protein VHM26_13095 [Chitinophagaceae bacterium]|nr:hypothetical protein [Chitinophagaceae bacterium]
MKRTLFPVACVLLLSLCLVNTNDSVFTMRRNVVYQQPDTSDIDNPVKLYYRSKSINTGSSDEWTYR